MELVVAILVLAGLVWLAGVCLRGWMLAGVAALLLTINCFGVHFFHFESPAGVMTLDRLLVVLLAACYAFQRFVGTADPKPFTRAEMGLLGGFLGLLVVSTFSHDRSQFIPPADVPPTWRLLAGYLVPVAIFWFTRQAKLTERGTTFFLTGLFVFGCYLTFTALAEYAQAWSLVWPRYIADPKIDIHFGRARGPMVHAPSLGLYLTATLFAGWLLWPKAPRWGRLALLATTPLFAIAIYATLTRMSWLGAGLALVVLLWLTLNRQWRTPVIGGLVICSALALVTNWERFIAFEREYSASLTRDSAELRPILAYVSWEMFQERPLFGFGFGQFSKAKLPFLADRSTEFTLESVRYVEQHNTPLSLLTEVGLVGLGLWMALMALWCRQAWRLARSPDVPEWVRRTAALALTVFAAWLLEINFLEASYFSNDTGLMFALFGLTSGLYAMHAPRRSPVPVVAGGRRNSDRPPQDRRTAVAAG